MMSERFVIGDDNLAMFEVIDMVKEELVCECRAVDVEKVVSLLNELAEENEQLRRLFEEMKQPITINLTEEDEKELRKLLGLIDDE